MSLAFIFPGQGSQAPGMGRDLAEKYPAAREVFEEADDALGFALSRLCFDGPAEELQLTENTQPAILAASVAALRAAEAEGLPRPDFVAGHSLGEYSALVAAGALTLGDAVQTVHKRGRYMQEAVPAGAGAQARDSLVRQVASPVRWRESVELLAREGVETFIEIGPGKVLSGLVRHTAPQARCLNVKDGASLEATLAALAAESLSNSQKAGGD